MAKKSGDRISILIKDVEKAAKQLRTGIRKRAKAAPRSLESAANRLRRGAADIARLVEKYVHEIRVELEGAKKPARKAAPKRKKTARKKTIAPSAPTF